MRFATFTMSDDPRERVGVCTRDAGRDPSAIRNQGIRGFHLSAFVRRRIFHPTYRAARTEFKCSANKPWEFDQ